jgi:cytochrome c-type biogenesis protein CcsB
MKSLLKLLPWFFVALFGLEIVAVMMPKKDGEFHVRDFARLPVLLSGRIQPMDSVARNALLQIRSTGDLPLEQVPSWQFWHHAKKLKATAWLLEVMTQPELADTRPVFLIHHAELLGELKLQDKGVEKSGLRYYTFNELKPLVGEIEQQARKAGDERAETQSSFQKQVIKLSNAIMLYQRLKVTLQPEGADDFPAELAEFRKNLGPAQAAALMSDGGKGVSPELLRKVAAPFQELRAMAEYGYPLIAPPLEPRTPVGGWQNAGSSVLSSLQAGELHPAMVHYAEMARAYRAGKAEEFNKALADYRAWLDPKFPKEVQKGGAEFYFNDVKPFLHAMIIYVFALVLAGGSLLAFGSMPNVCESLRRSAFYLILIAGAVHTFGLVFRMVLEGRPPVTNLYSSAIFIGWGTMVLGAIIERIYRVSIGSLVASVAGFVTLLIAHNLALGGDTMEMLRAVLDTNFWLATHVVVITLGYAATFFAGLLALFYVVLGVFTPMLPRRLAAGGGNAAAAAPGVGGDLGKALSKMVYGIVCFATLFSFIGTVLGGIWADQSWGRFWGWDPKENGALLIVLWNAIILHARWGGLVKERGIMNLAIFGNIVTSFSWFGVNLLGIGLHSYGFTDTGAEYLLSFVISQMFLLGCGLLAIPAWKSFQTPAAARVAPLLRAALGMLGVLWFLCAVLWIASIASQQHDVGFGNLFQSLPWLGLVGKVGVFITTGFAWIVALASGPAVPEQADSGAPMSGKPSPAAS